MKYFRMPYEEVMYKRSYINLILLNRAIPGIKPFGKKDEEEEVGSKTFEDAISENSSSQQHASNFFMQFT